MEKKNKFLVIIKNIRKKNKDFEMKNGNVKYKLPKYSSLFFWTLL